MAIPEFSLKNSHAVLGLLDDPGESKTAHGRRSTRTDPSQSATGGSARIARWARSAGRCAEAEDFSQRLAGRQIDRELTTIFRETPEFGRSIAERIAEFHDSSTEGPLILIGAGGEAVVFFEPETQCVIKLFGGESKAGFGWLIDQNDEGRWIVRPGGLEECLKRYALAEEQFPTDLEFDCVGECGAFLTLSQPFIVGENPTEKELANWMIRQGWERYSPPADLEMLARQTWKRDEVVATDVRSENAIRAEIDGQIYPFDFILWEP